MNPLSRAPAPDTLFRQLVQDDEESAAMAQFVRLYQQSPKLRHWLQEDYGRDAQLRSRFHAVANQPDYKPPTRFAELTGDANGWNEERRQLKARVSGRIYGGLTCSEMEKLILRYQSGSIDQGAFLLAHEWRQAGDAAFQSPVLSRAAFLLVETALRGGQLRLLRHLTKAASFLTSYANKRKRRSAVGFSDWWKLHALFFILRHPSGSYRTRELRAYLAQQGLDIGTKDIRRFCTRHGIRRDMRAGRPRKKA